MRINDGDITGLRMTTTNQKRLDLPLRGMRAKEKYNGHAADSGSQRRETNPWPHAFSGSRGKRASAVSRQPAARRLAADGDFFDIFGEFF